MGEKIFRLMISIDNRQSLLNVVIQLISSKLIIAEQICKQAFIHFLGLLRYCAKTQTISPNYNKRRWELKFGPQI